MGLPVFVLAASSLLLNLVCASEAIENDGRAGDGRCLISNALIAAAPAPVSATPSASPTAPAAAPGVTGAPTDSGTRGATAEGNSQAAAQNSATKSNSSATLLHPALPQGILSHAQQTQAQHQPGIISRALGGVVSDAAHATMALVGTTILNQGIDLPPDDASKPEWPFNEPHRKAMYMVEWADGSQAKVSRLPDGSIQILGGGRRYVLQPEGEGSFAMFGDYGSMATVTPRPGGGFTIMKADGTVEQVLPREGGGFTVTGGNGVIATVLPGVAGRKHMIRGGGLSSGFIQ